MQRSGFGSAYAETGGVARLRVSLSLSFWGLLCDTPTPALRLGFYRFGLKDQSAYAGGSHSGLPGRRKTAYQVS